MKFDNKNINAELKFYYTDAANEDYLEKLKLKYSLDTITSKYESEFDKTRIILNWAHNQWIHSEDNAPSKSDPLTILEEAEKGNNFRCVEYGIVSSAALNSIRIPSRVIGLKTADVQKTEYGSGHIAIEHYSTEFEKWIFMDGQFNAIPILNNETPLNAVEFQKAITENIDSISIINATGEFSKEEKESYINYISQYLYYFDTKFDNRYIYKDNLSINGKTHLMLVPLGSKNPSVFQGDWEMGCYIYTNNLNNFYQKPDLCYTIQYIQVH